MCVKCLHRNWQTLDRLHVTGGEKKKEAKSNREGDSLKVAVEAALITVLLFCFKLGDWHGDSCSMDVCVVPKAKRKACLRNTRDIIAFLHSGDGKPRADQFRASASPSLTKG